MIMRNWIFLSALIGMLVLGMGFLKRKTIAPDSPKVFKNTPLEPVIKLHSKAKFDKINQFFEDHSDLIDYQEPMYGQSLVQWASRNSYYDFCHLLLEKGANPNLSSFDGTTALIHAAKLPHSSMVRLLLKNAADPNIVAQIKPIDTYQPMRTALIVAAAASFESVKLLVDSGADINYTCKEFKMQNALVSALTAEKIEIARYLIIDKKINLDNIIQVDHKKDTIDVRTYLRNLAFPLESEQYQIKMEIVNYLLRNRIDYWKTPVPRQMYNNFSHDYLKRY